MLSATTGSAGRLVRRWWWRAERRGRIGARERAARSYLEAATARREVLEATSASRSYGVGLTDYHFLHAFVTQKRPRRVLELGSGRSTLILAQALAELGAAHPERGAAQLVTLEQIPEFHAELQRLMPEKLAPYVNSILCPGVIGSWRGIRGVQYEALPEGRFDLVFVDGPKSLVQGGRHMPCLDALRLLERDPDAELDLVFDRRLVTERTVQSFLPRGSVGFDPIMDLGFAPGVSGKQLLSTPQACEHLTRLDIWRASGVDPARLH